MTPQKFVGATSREVLQKVKHALGDDALIVSNRPFANGIEVTALAASDLSGARPRRSGCQCRRNCRRGHAVDARGGRDEGDDAARIRRHGVDEHGA
jgi:flagellar biosynthesis GTPase FlhF